MELLGIIVAIVTALGSAATAVGVIFAVQQIRLAKQLAQTQFEDDLTKQFRQIVYRIPIEALLGKEMSEEQFNQTRDDFFHYIDLSNEQVFLRHHNRIGGATWRLWCEGIKTYLSRPSFARAWGEFKENSPGNFRELRRLEDEGFNTDPRDWNDPAILNGSTRQSSELGAAKLSGR
ncbi:MAG TPA: hypothetical protein VE360_03965 [Pyrinomonadaceae bacterium]|nr:hypothetical protein [Pyrinomonadaceae bacterium]